MQVQDLSRRDILRYGLYAGVAITLSNCTGGNPSSPRGDGESSGSSNGLPDVEGPEVVTDPAKFPTEFSEAPWFADLVAAGTLPPVQERIGQDPLVIRPLQGIGRYGGTIRRGAIGSDDRQNSNRFCAGPDNLLYWDYTYSEVIPNIARSYELSDDFHVMTLSLRRGMRWSDGQPFTADDIMFWYQHMNLNEGISPGSTALGSTRIEKIDDYTVEFISEQPKPLLPAYLAGDSDLGGQTAFGSDTGGGCFAPAHYLSQFHAEFTSEAEANQLATEAGFASWRLYLLIQNNWNTNVDLPTVTPWTLSRPMNEPPWEFTANPYSIWVDNEGNQLPYIQGIKMQSAAETQAIGIRTAAGDFDFQDRHLAIASMPVLLENQERGDYTIYQAPSSTVDFTVKFDLSYNIDPVIGELIRTTDFRRALSLAIERDDVNKAFLLDTGTPTATMAADDSPYFPGPEWRLKWAEHDLEQANELLDSIGLTDRDDAGFRLLPGGTNRILLDYQAGTAFADFVGFGNMLRRQWAEIGIDTNVTQATNNLLTERSLAGQIMLTGGQGGSEEPFLSSRTLIPTSVQPYQGLIGIPYAHWFLSDGEQGTEPPPSMNKLKDAYEIYQQGLQAGEDERIELGQELFRLHADEVWSIGAVGFGLAVYGLYAAKNNMKNVPRRIKSTNNQKAPTNALPQTFYYEQ